MFEDLPYIIYVGLTFLPSLNLTAPSMTVLVSAMTHDRRSELYDDATVVRIRHSNCPHFTGFGGRLKGTERDQRCLTAPIGTSPSLGLHGTNYFWSDFLSGVDGQVYGTPRKVKNILSTLELGT